MKRIIRRIETAARLQSAISIIAIVFSSLAVVLAADAQDKGTIYVDCDKASGGDGSKRARPLPTITAALDRARDLGGAKRAEIVVAAGVCDQETLPIVLDFSASVTGARKSVLRDGRPDGTQTADTLLMAPIPGGNITFFIITAEDVTISHLSIDGGLLPPLTARGRCPLGCRSAFWLTGPITSPSTTCGSLAPGRLFEARVRVA